MAGKRSSKQEILRKLSTRTGISIKELSYIWEEMFDLIREELKKGRNVTLVGLGTFIFKDIPPRISNMTGEIVPRHNKIKFRFNQKFARYIRVMTREK